ncbi:MAG: hypothetical protein E7324_09375 [Clostridiales bacterium]|nr:hypothetical protein [Clostridiales bacterium]
MEWLLSEWGNHDLLDCPCACFAAAALWPPLMRPCGQQREANAQTVRSLSFTGKMADFLRLRNIQKQFSLGERERVFLFQKKHPLALLLYFTPGGR